MYFQPIMKYSAKLGKNVFSKSGIPQKCTLHISASYHKMCSKNDKLNRQEGMMEERKKKGREGGKIWKRGKKKEEGTRKGKLDKGEK